jgi:hypothetical protein
LGCGGLSGGCQKWFWALADFPPEAKSAFDDRRTSGEGQKVLLATGGLPDRYPKVLFGHRPTSRRSSKVLFPSRRLSARAQKCFLPPADSRFIAKSAFGEKSEAGMKH